MKAEITDYLFRHLGRETWMKSKLNYERKWQIAVEIEAQTNPNKVMYWSLGKD